MIPHSRPTLSEAEICAVSQVIRSGHIAQGEVVAEFERKVARYIGLRHAVATSSGTSALFLTLMALGVGAGDEVVMPSYVCSAPFHAAVRTGATPLLADVDPDTFNLNPDDIEKKVTPRTKVVILPHMFGLPGPLDEILRLGIPVVEDCAMSIGARYKGGWTGSFGRVAVFSFYATKMMTTGEGGMVATNCAEIADIVRDLRDYDRKPNLKLRLNFKMTDIGAAMGIVQLERLGSFISRRRQIAKAYSDGLKTTGLKLPETPPDRDHIFFRYVVGSRNSERMITTLQGAGIMAQRPVFRPLHHYLNMPSTEFPGTEEVFERTVSLPIYPLLTDEEVEQIIRTIKGVQ
ncbi:MAG TPA: DegT/DnrJ/EryC1/StrS family aminotransferase [Candidatus Latescibacteria bacterium]|nr:DegT/DnrJ/EryC1/StrS family aminotransferase [Candidatus Latescibacterota bacterium]